MRRPLIALAVAALALAACRETAQTPPPLPDPLAAITADCTRSGGRMVARGTAQLCLHETRDSGKSCSRASDCEGDCLARSRSCAPARPMLGCHEILMSGGERAMQCLQ